MTGSPASIAAVHVLAAGDSDFGAGFIAFSIVLVLSVASFFLFRSMNRHLRKVPDTFETPPGEEKAG
jgi:hypothetical protein